MFGKKSEFVQYKFLVDGLSDEILKKRVETSLRFYITRANKYRKRDAFLGMASIVLPAFATFAAAAASFYEEQYPSLDLAVPVITLIATVTAGVIAHFKFSEKKQNYRNLAESMKSEVAMYECRAQKYSREKTEDEEQAKDIFLQAIEKIIEDGYRKSREVETAEQSIAENRG